MQYFFCMWSLGLAQPHPYTQGFTSSPHKQHGMTHHTVPLLHVIFWPYGQQPHPYTQELTYVMQIRSLQLGLPSRRWGNHTSKRRHHKEGVITCHKDGVITNIIAQGQSHIKISQVKCIQIHSLLPSSFIRYFNNQISTIFSKSSKPFLVKNVLHQLSQLSKHL